eukprot:562754-Rhodomonas_salina.3
MGSAGSLQDATGHGHWQVTFPDTSPPGASPASQLTDAETLGQEDLLVALAAEANEPAAQHRFQRDLADVESCEVPPLDRAASESADEEQFIMELPRDDL